MLNTNKDTFKENTENKTTILYFWAEWCDPCKKQKIILSSLKKELSFDILSINTDGNNELVMECKVGSIPALIIYKDGKVIQKHEGVQSKEFIKAILKHIN